MGTRHWGSSTGVGALLGHIGILGLGCSPRNFLRPLVLALAFFKGFELWTAVYTGVRMDLQGC